MAFSFNSVGHFLAKAFQVLSTAVKLAPVVEDVTSVVPGAAQALAIEKAGFAVLGEIASLLTAGGDAAKAKLTDAGLDANGISIVEAVLADVPELVTLAKAL